MNNSAVAMDYARVLFEVCEENKIEAEMLYDMRKIDEIDSGEIHNFLTYPIIKDEIQYALIESIEKLEIRVELINLMKILISRHDFKYFHEILSEYKIIYQRKANIKYVKVTSANKLDSDTIDMINKSLEEKLKCLIVIDSRVNPELIGGIKIEYDGKVVDNTISKHLKLLNNI